MISVIIPIYNTERYLKRCIDSVLGSDYGEYEVILVDDGSKDGSLEICKAYARRESRVRVIEQGHRGVSEARNRGIRESRGDWIIFIDSDDFISHDFLGMVEKKEYGDEELLIFDFASASEKCRVPTMLPSHPPTVRYGEEDNLAIVERLLRFRQLIKGGHTDLRSPCAKAYRRRVIEEYGLRFLAELTMGEDQIFHIGYQMRTKRCAYIMKPVYYVETRPDSTTRSFRGGIMEEYLLFGNCLKDILDKEGCLPALEEAYYDTVLANMKGILVLGIFHPASSRTYKENLLLCQNMYDIPLFQRAVEQYNGKMGEISRRILLFFFRQKSFYIVRWICRLGHIRMKWRKR